MSLSIQEKINRLQRIIIVHSFLYYELDFNIVSDKEYDDMCKKLVKYKNDYPELWTLSEYHKQFGDEYNGCTGYTLYHDLDKHQKSIIESIAYTLRRPRL